MRWKSGTKVRFGAAALAVAGVCMAGQTSPKPNVVVVFIDDMGYGDIGPFGGTHPTPHLDRMAEEGMTLTDFYVSSVACTPSRSALLTGCYAERIGMGGNVVFPGDKRGLNPDEVTVAEILKAEGYATGCFGKWHLGDQPEFMPLAQGFDEFEGIPYSNDMWVKGNPKHNFPPLPYMKQDKAVAHIPDEASQAVLTDAISDAAIDFIKRHKDESFFAYVPLAAVHTPWFATKKRVDSAAGSAYKAQISEIDELVGRVMTTLRELKIDQKTLIFFTNDNGGFGKSDPGPLRGGKFGPKYEGNMRVATLAWWPGQIAAGSVCREIGRSVDVLPTLARLAGGQVPADRIIDGKDISDLLLVSGAKSPTTTLYYQDGGIRQGKWKLVRHRNKQGWHDELYDLESDLGEKNNLVARHPEKVSEMKALLEAHAKNVKRNTRPAAFVENPKVILTDSNGLPTLADYRNE